jgi:glycosyltransferase involved in cell wall biosynthesis
MPVRNILYIVSCLERGGLELRLLDFARRFPAEVKIHICVTSTLLDLLDKFNETPAKIFVVPIKRAYQEFNNISTISTYIRDHNITVVNTYDFKGLLVGCLLKLSSRSHFSLVHNTVDLLHSYKAWHKRILKYLFMFVDKSICNSVQAQDVLVSLGVKASLITVIVNGVDTEVFKRDPVKRDEMRAYYGVCADETLIGTVANFRWEKNYPFLIESFAVLVSKYTRVKLLCVGGGSALEEIKSFAQQKNVFDKIIFTGSVDNVPDYLGVMDIFVLCSIKESFPNCLIQAMSASLPVVASDIGACSNIIVHGNNGFTFEVNNVNQFIERIEQLLSDKLLSQKLATSGAVMVKERFSIHAMTEAYLRLYSEVIPA